MVDDLSNSEKKHQTSVQSRRGTRHDVVPHDEDESKSFRLGRRESEPHSSEVSYLFEVLQTNFPKDRTMWDLHHYFLLGGEEVDLQFDISFFRDFQLPVTLSSYKAIEFKNRIPTVVINVLSKSTWMKDLGLTVDTCRLLKIPLYVLFSPYSVTSKTYEPPFLRVYQLTSNGDYKTHELRKITLKEGGDVDSAALIDVGNIVEFQFGLMELNKRHYGDKTLYRLIFVNPKTNELLLTQAEQAEARAEQAEVRAEQAEKELKSYRQKNEM